MARSGARAALLATLPALTGCGGGFGVGGAPPAVPTASAVPGAARHYTLHAGDRLHVAVFGEPELSGELDLDVAGLAALPLAGDVRLAGLTVEQAERRLADALAPDYLRDPQIRIEVLAYRSLYVLGEVRRPGAYEFQPGLTVLEAVALAGGFSYRAREDTVTILRRRGARAAEFEGGPGTRLQPGDAIRVWARYF